tara:strand:- start:851 stop:1531 length:681 start_codon:yes stop_codon:yes gene_type:complete
MNVKHTSKRGSKKIEYLAEERQALLERTLVHVPFDGWTLASLKASAVDLDYEWSVARRAFPRGMRDLIAFFEAETDRRMVAAFADIDFQSMRIRDRIAAAVRTRLELCASHHEACRRLVAYYALPGNALAGFQVIYSSINLMWCAAGDSATDFNFYTKRGLLAGVYGSTILFWLNDKSENCADTWAFLDRRIADVMEIQKVRGRAERGLDALGRILQRGAVLRRRT